MNLHSFYFTSILANRHVTELTYFDEMNIISVIIEHNGCDEEAK